MAAIDNLFDAADTLTLKEFTLRFKGLNPIIDEYIISRLLACTHCELIIDLPIPNYMTPELVLFLFDLSLHHPRNAGWVGLYYILEILQHNVLFIDWRDLMLILGHPGESSLMHWLYTTDGLNNMKQILAHRNCHVGVTKFEYYPYVDSRYTILFQLISVLPLWMQQEILRYELSRRVQLSVTRQLEIYDYCIRNNICKELIDYNFCEKVCVKILKTDYRGNLAVQVLQAKTDFVI